MFCIFPFYLHWMITERCWITVHKLVRCFRLHTKMETSIASGIVMNFCCGFNSLSYSLLDTSQGWRRHANPLRKRNFDGRDAQGLFLNSKWWGKDGCSLLPLSRASLLMNKPTFIWFPLRYINTIKHSCENRHTKALNMHDDPPDGRRGWKQAMERMRCLKPAFKGCLYTDLIFESSR